MQSADVDTDLSCRDLAAELTALDLRNAVIVALSPSSVDFAFSLAKRLGYELDLLLTGRIGAPGHPEQTIGSVVDLPVPQAVIDEGAARAFRLPPGYLDTELQHQFQELERRHLMYLGDDDARRHDHAGKDIVLVHDGADTALLRLVIARLQQGGARSVRVAEVEQATGQPVDDRAVAQLLKEARRIHGFLH